MQGSPVFLYAGQVTNLRAVRILICAFKNVVRARPQPRLPIADRGPHSPTDRLGDATVRRRMCNWTSEFGLPHSTLPLSYEGDLSSWINACNAVVLPYATTGYSPPPQTLLEAIGHSNLSSRHASAASRKTWETDSPRSSRHPEMLQPWPKPRFASTLGRGRRSDGMPEGASNCVTDRKLSQPEPRLSITMLSAWGPRQGASGSLLRPTIPKSTYLPQGMRQDPGYTHPVRSD
jgi:hypothetical protein